MPEEQYTPWAHVETSTYRIRVGFSLQKDSGPQVFVVKNLPTATRKPREEAAINWSSCGPASPRAAYVMGSLLRAACAVSDGLDNGAVITEAVVQDLLDRELGREGDG